MKMKIQKAEWTQHKNALWPQSKVELYNFLYSASIK